jgi:polyprenyl synthetase
MEYPELHEELKQVKAMMHASITIENKQIREAIWAVLESGGKMVRPAYLILFSMWNENRNKEEVHAVAAALELLHVATLLHDDVIDEADTRRGQETISARFGNRVAIYAGDYLLTVCYQLLSKYSQDLAGIQIPTDGMMRVIEGELSQMEESYKTDVTVQDYLKRIDGKTAQLFMLSCMMGERFSEMGELERARHIGNSIGMAFQLLDDILDYEVSSSEFGKPVLEDVAQGIYTLPLIASLPKCEKELLPLLEKKNQLTAPDRLAIQKLVVNAGGVETAKDFASKYTMKAIHQIEKLPEADVKPMLLKITNQLLQRKS